MRATTRKKFTEAIEAGIAASGFPDDDVESLRAVSEQSNYFCARQFEDRETGASCPLTQAGLAVRSRRGYDTDLDAFFSVFDRYYDRASYFVL